MIVVKGGSAAYRALVFGPQNQSNQNFFDSQVASVINAGNEFGQAFANRVLEIRETFNNSAAVQLAKAALNRTRGIFSPNVVKTLTEVQDMQIAKSVMQRWMMANPVARELYNHQRCDGFSDSYVDMQPGKIGENHYDYRRVMDGMVQMSEDGFFIDMYAEQILPEDEDFDFDEQRQVLRTWMNLEHAIALAHKDPEKHRDPTSAWNNSL